MFCMGKFFLWRKILVLQTSAEEADGQDRRTVAVDAGVLAATEVGLLLGFHLRPLRFRYLGSARVHWLILMRLGRHCLDMDLLNLKIPLTST